MYRYRTWLGSRRHIIEIVESRGIVANIRVQSRDKCETDVDSTDRSTSTDCYGRIKSGFIMTR